MSEAAGSEFTNLWSCVSTLCDSKIQEKKRDQQMPGSSISPMYKGFQSPKGRGYGRYTGLYNGDSPGDMEPTQDIFWDSTSPTPSNTGLRNTRVVEISDIVNRIAPKDTKRKGTESPLLQWIGDSAVPCTPDIPKSRVRKSSRQSSVDDLVKLARQFDKNMQEDRETSERPYANDDNLNECGNKTKQNITKLRERLFPTNETELKCPSSSDQVEAELNALFDCSTQKVSGQLSQGSSASACTQEVNDQPVNLSLVEPRQSKLKSADRSGSAAHPDQEKASCCLSANNIDEFDDDDWENDDLLNDSFVLAITQNPDELYDTTHKMTLQSNTNRNITPLTSACKPTSDAAHKPSELHSKPSYSALRELCYKPKTTNQSTFKLEPSPHSQPTFTARKDSKPSVTVIHPKFQMSEQQSTISKKCSTPQTDNIGNDQKETRLEADSVKYLSYSQWDDGDDDVLLYQACDSVERISNTLPQQVSRNNCQEKQDVAADRQQGTSTPLPIDTAWSVNPVAGTKRQSPCAFPRSNSLPRTSCEAVNYQGWNVAMKGANNRSRLSQSLEGSHPTLDGFNPCRDSAGTVHTGKANMGMKPHTVIARATHKSCHTAFKRHLSDSACKSNKVFVTNQMTGKCSAAEIERKKQEALARRRLRMQNAPKS